MEKAAQHNQNFVTIMSLASSPAATAGTNIIEAAVVFVH